jgi:hypothetical protein
MSDELAWLERTARAVADARSDSAISSTARSLLGKHSSACLGLAVYLTCMSDRQAACRVGNFEFWSWDRLTSDEQSPEQYGGQEQLLIIADWMLDSEFCAVDCYDERMVFLGGANPIRSTLRLREFLELVVRDPETPHGML